MTTPPPPIDSHHCQLRTQAKSCHRRSSQLSKNRQKVPHWSCQGTGAVNFPTIVRPTWVVFGRSHMSIQSFSFPGNKTQPTAVAGEPRRRRKNHQKVASRRSATAGDRHLSDLRPTIPGHCRPLQSLQSTLTDGYNTRPSSAVFGCLSRRKTAIKNGRKSNPPELSVIVAASHRRHRPPDHH